METIEKSKYDQMLGQYNTALNDSEIAAKVAEIIEKKTLRDKDRHKNNSKLK